ncbi:hypothetical protein CIP107570_01126 [Corynebacterium diphtheriae]|nr:hypothetical protein CIP107570_01126 [Corynebacterium diphtheriae]
MVFVHILIVLAAIVLGARLGSIAIGFAGGIGVLLLGATGVPVTREDIPFDVIGIIMAVIAAISAMQRAGDERRYSFRRYRYHHGRYCSNFCYAACR